MQKNQKQEENLQKVKRNTAEIESKATQETLKLDHLEQHGRIQNLEFKGVPVTEKENTAAIVVALAKLLDIEIDKKDISISHRLAENKRSTEPPAINARLVGRKCQKCYLQQQKHG